MLKHSLRSLTTHRSSLMCPVASSSKQAKAFRITSSGSVPEDGKTIVITKPYIFSHVHMCAHTHTHNTPTHHPPTHHTPTHHTPTHTTHTPHTPTHTHTTPHTHQHTPIPHHTHHIHRHRHTHTHTHTRTYRSASPQTR